MELAILVSRLNLAGLCPADNAAADHRHGTRGNDAVPVPATAAIARSDQVERRTMIVGPEISLSGDINSCNRLIGEGTVEVRLHDCRELDISATGLFKGSAAIESAEISGRFEGDLVVRKRC